jgi:transposase
MSNTLYVGIDVSKDNNVVYIMKPDGSKFSNFKVPNNQRGAEKLVKRISAVMTSLHLSAVDIGLESTGIYGQHLVYFLKEDGNLSKFTRRLFVLNPTRVKKFSETYEELEKNDYVDSFVIADCLRFGRINNGVYEGDYRYDALKQLTRARYRTVVTLSKEKQRFANLLFMKCSSLTQEKVFSNTFGATALSLYEDFETIDDIISMDFDDLVEYIITKGKNRFSDPECVAKSVQAAARGSYRLPKTVNNSVNQALSLSISSISAMESTVKSYDKIIAEQLALIPNTLMSIKGIGPVFAAGIIAEVGDINRFSNQAALAKYAGLAWKRHQSGSFDAQDRRMIRTGNRYLRYYLCEAAMSLVRCDQEYDRYYHLKYKEVNKFQHKRALVLTARKLVRLVFRLLKDNRLYISPENY